MKSITSLHLALAAGESARIDNPGDYDVISVLAKAPPMDTHYADLAPIDQTFGPLPEKRKDGCYTEHGHVSSLDIGFLMDMHRDAVQMRDVLARHLHSALPDYWQCRARRHEFWRMRAEVLERTLVALGVKP